jgi:phospholipid transport system substrate-binding protein
MLLRSSTRNFRVFGALGALFLFSTSSPVTAQPSNAVQSFVQENIDKGYALLNNDALSEAQRNNQFRGFMLSLMDTRRVGRFTLGPYANSASPADLAAYEKAFANYAVAMYQSRLDQFKHVKVRVTGETQLAPDDIVVNAELSGPSLPNPASPIRAGFRIRKADDGRPVITDMEVEGIWLALWERADFMGFLQQHGGSVAALTEHLRSQAGQIGGDAPANTGAR